jgi:hypothetical protein
MAMLENKIVASYDIYNNDAKDEVCQVRNESRCAAVVSRY